MNQLSDPRSASCFRFVRAEYDASLAQASLVYTFDQGPELVERIVFPEAPWPLPAEHQQAFERALAMLHWIVGVSYYKAGVPAQLAFDQALPDPQSAALLTRLYRRGLGEFAWRNGLDLESLTFPAGPAETQAPPPVVLPRRSLVPVGGGKDSLLSIELLRSAAEPMTLCWIGRSGLISACVEQAGLPALNIERQIAPELFEYNRMGAWNGHVPVTAINSAILVLAALLYGYDAVVFSNESSANAGNLGPQQPEVNHQYSKSLEFEQLFGAWVQQRLGTGLEYYSLLRPFSELEITRRFATLEAYHPVFSSCNRNFRILGARPQSRWCGECPKCHFVFLALAPFMAKTRLLRIFGRNLLDDASLDGAFDALLEWQAHKPFECVGEGDETRAAMLALTQRAEWREDHQVRRFVRDILPAMEPPLALEVITARRAEHRVPQRLWSLIDAA